ncbi:MAG: glucose dehydrogenase [Planctomycetales bacterium 12-60-4]|nr:MAG: glucose dehydrogenase [Planctomycetales bacterium 12-60-4]
MKLLGRKALVTGAAGGIGLGCALELARAGADLVINDLEDSPQAAEAVTQLQLLGRQADFVAGDVFEHDSGGLVVAKALELLGGIDIFVSNPAYSKRGDFLDYPRETFERVLTGTLSGGFSMAQHVARHMVSSGRRGKIIFVSSVHAHRPYARSVAYNAGKAGLDHLARTIAVELLPHRINVNVINPGWINTPGERRTFGEAAIATDGPKLPWGRIGEPADIGRAAVFLASDDADYITGASLVVDGGFSLRDALP